MWSRNGDLALHVERLARACEVDRAGLHGQFKQLEDMARLEAATSRCDNKEAWRRVVLRLAGVRRSTRELYPLDCIRPVIERWFAFCASTSGVEQSFTKGQHAFGNKQLGSLPLHKWSVLKLKVDASSNNPDELCKIAQQVWSRCFGIPRASGAERKRRLDAGLVKSCKRNGTSEAEFLRRRRQATTAAQTPDEVRRHVDELEVPWPQRANFKRLLSCLVSF